MDLLFFYRVSTTGCGKLCLRSFVGKRNEQMLHPQENNLLDIRCIVHSNDPALNGLLKKTLPGRPLKLEREIGAIGNARSQTDWHLRQFHHRESCFVSQMRPFLLLANDLHHLKRMCLVQSTFSEVTRITRFTNENSAQMSHDGEYHSLKILPRQRDVQKMNRSLALLI